MALSEEEQRLLEQMEAALAAEDPKLVNTLRGTGVRKLHRRRAAVAGVGFFVGLALLVVGMYLMSDGPIGFVALSLVGIRPHGGGRGDRDLLVAARGHERSDAGRRPSSGPPGHVVGRNLHGQDGGALAPPARRVRLLTPSDCSTQPSASSRSRRLLCVRLRCCRC